MMKQLWNPSNVWPKFSEISFFLLNKCYPQVSRIPLLPALSRITFSWILWRKEIHIYNFCFVTFFILNMCFFFFPLLKCTTQESSGVLEPPGAEGLHVLFRVTVLKVWKEVCLPSVWIHKPKRERCDGDGEVQGWEMEGEEKNKGGRQEFFSACWGKAANSACMWI